MTADQEKKFKEDYRDIMYCWDLISQNGRYIARLTRLDKNDSHKDYIVKAQIKRDKLQENLKKLLNGKSYEYWKAAHEELRDLHLKLSRAIARKSAIEKEIIDFKF